MFDIAPTELLLVCLVALVVIGPKDLPKALRIVGRWVGRARSAARHFRSGLDTMMREAELEEMARSGQNGERTPLPADARPPQVARSIAEEHL